LDRDHQGKSSPENWSEIFLRFCSQWERSQRGLSHLQKLRERQQALSAGTPEEIFLALKQITERWATLPVRESAEGSPEIVNNTLLSPLWHRALAAGFQASLAGDSATPEILRRLTDQFDSEQPDLEKLIQDLRSLWIRMDLRDERTHSNQEYLRKSLFLLFSGAKEFFDKDPWFGQELESLRPLFAAADPEQTQKGYAALQHLLSRQEQRLEAVQEVDQALQELLRLVFDYLADLEEEKNGQGYRELLRLSEQIQKAQDMQEVQSLARELVERTRSLQDHLRQSKEALGKAKEHLEKAQQRVKDLEQEISDLQLLVHEDPLTRILNRRGLQLAFLQESARCSRQNLPLAVAMLDLDHFKKVNDQYGHEAGDLVLQQFSQILQTSLRGTDRIGRYGGEEFVVLMSATDPDNAVRILERILGRLLSAPMDIGKHHIPVSFSAGVSAWHPGESLEKTLARADRALYRAKREGRQRIYQSEDETDPG